MNSLGRLNTEARKLVSAKSKSEQEAVATCLIQNLKSQI